MSDRVIPEGFDLEAAKRQRSSTPDDDRGRCPYCGSVNLAPLQPDKPDGNKPDDPKKWMCGKCRERFDEPI